MEKLRRDWNGNPVEFSRFPRDIERRGTVKARSAAAHGGCSCNRSNRCNRLQCTCCLTVPACGRATSALSARYTPRTSAIVAYATPSKRQFSRLRVTFHPRFSDRFPSRGNSLGACLPAYARAIFSPLFFLPLFHVDYDLDDARRCL